MAEAIHRLVYYSRNRIPGAAADIAPQIEGILRASRRNNVTLGVTGALMFNAGCFAQVLEGPPAAVESTFERIQRDERHGDVSLLAFGPVPARAFATWSMAFVGGAAADLSRFHAISGRTGFDPSRLTAEALFGVLHRLLLEAETEAA